MKKSLMFALLMISSFPASALAWPWPSYENECKVGRISEVATLMPRGPSMAPIAGRFVYFKKCKNVPQKFKAFVPEKFLKKIAHARDNGTAIKGSIRTGILDIFKVLHRMEDL